MDPTYESLRPAKEFAAPGRRILWVRAEPQFLKARKVQRVYLTDGNQASSVIVLVSLGKHPDDHQQTQLLADFPRAIRSPALLRGFRNS